MTFDPAACSMGLERSNTTHLLLASTISAAVPQTLYMKLTSNFPFSQYQFIIPNIKLMRLRSTTFVANIFDTTKCVRKYVINVVPQLN
jgi:hypothetical protein